MTDWSRFPTHRITTETKLWRIHNADSHPAYFNDSSNWRFGPSPTHKGKFGTCYLGLDDPRPAYLEKYGRRGVITPELRHRDALSELAIQSPVDVADLTNRSVLGRFNVTASHSTGNDYGPSQRLAADLFDASLGGIRYRISHDPQMELEAIVVQGLRSRPGSAEIAVALGVATVYFMVFVRMGSHEERTHLIEYGIVALLIHAALNERAMWRPHVPAPAVLAVTITTFLGVLDELIQALLPARVFDLRDILFNTLAAILAVGAIKALRWARQRAGR